MDLIGFESYKTLFVNESADTGFFMDNNEHILNKGSILNKVNGINVKTPGDLRNKLSKITTINKSHFLPTKFNYLKTDK